MNAMASQMNTATEQTTSQSETEPSRPPTPLNNKEFKAWLLEKYNKCGPRKPFAKREYPNYKDPDEVDSQVINLSDLEDPPSEFEIPYLGNRNPTMPQAVALVAHHFWNINAEKPLKNSEERIAAFRKLVFNQDEQFRIQNVHELSQLGRDAGPRLLKPEILRRLGKVPISRHYPEFPEGTDWEEQRTQPVYFPEEEKSGGNVRGSDGVGDGRDSLTLQEIPPNLNIVQEYLERLLIQLRYQELEVTSTQGEALGLNAVIDTSEGSRRKRLPLRKIPLALDLNHDVECDTVHSSHIIYNYREQGPAGTLGEDLTLSRYDCIVMAAKFLDVGITKIDINNLQASGIQETQSHRLFVNLVRADWKRDDSVGIRQSFHRFFDSLGATNFRDLMYKATFLRGQFSHTASLIAQCESGHESALNKATGSLLCLDYSSINDRPTGVSMQQILQSIFPQCEQTPAPEGQTQDNPCNVQDCKEKVIEKIICRSMPLRIAVSLSSQVSPADHTSNDIRIKFYDDKEGKEDVAVYRWLGGIYADTDIERPGNTRYRIYWTDLLRGEKPSGTITMYDPYQANGLVIEGVSPSYQNEPIPAGWWQGKFKPALFYERVFNPNSNDITLAAAVLGDIKYASDEGRYILQLQNRHWTFSPPSKDDSGNLGGSIPSNSNNSSTSGGPSAYAQLQGITGYAGAFFDHYFNNTNSACDTQMQDEMEYSEPSSNTYFQNTGDPGVAGAGYGLNQNIGPVPSTAQAMSGNEGSFIAFGSNMQQSAPDRPRRMLEKQYAISVATKNSATNPISQNIGVPGQQFIPDPTNTSQVSSFQPQGLQTGAHIGSNPSINMQAFNQTISRVGNGIPNTTSGLEYLQQSPPISSIYAEIQQQGEGHREQTPSNSGANSLNFQEFQIVPHERLQQEILDTLPDFPSMATMPSR